jgi:sRNA-binding protein
MKKVEKPPYDHELDKPQDEAHKPTMKEIKDLVRDSKRVHANRVTNHEIEDKYSLNRREQEESVVDTKTLVVGQKVWMKSGIYYGEGKVAKVTSDGVTVQTDIGPWRFDNDGKNKACEGNSTFEYGPWYIIDK